MIAKLQCALLVGMLVAGWSLGGCMSPGNIDPTLLNRYQEKIVAKSPQLRAGTQGLEPYEPMPGTTGPQLTVQTVNSQVLIPLTLDEAIMRALANSLDIRVVSYDPAIAYQDMVVAASEFDYIVFGSARYQETDQQLLVNSTETVLVGSAFVQRPIVVDNPGQSQVNVYQAGIRKKFITGGQAAVAFTSTRNWSSADTSPTTWQPALTLEFNQPLLRNAGPEVNLARLRVAQINRKISQEQFRQRVEETISTVVSLYWQLAQARRNVEIQEALLESTIRTLETVRERLQVDATIVEVSQAEAAVKSREAFLVRTKKNVQDVQDQLTRVIADAQLNLIDDYQIIPASAPVVTQVDYDPADQLLVALRRNAQLEQARLQINVSEITVRVAKNQTLPQLDLTGSVNVTGLDQGFDSAFERLTTGRFVGYAIGLEGEYPLGNRQRIAELRKAQLQNGQTITQYQDAIDRLGTVVKERIREVRTSYLEMQAQHASVVAAQVQLEALQDTEKIRGRLTPEFLNVKLQAQQTLAIAQAGETAAVAGYNTAMAELARSTGTILDDHGVKLSAVALNEAWPTAAAELPRLAIEAATQSQPALEDMPPIRIPNAVGDVEQLQPMTTPGPLE